MKKVFALFCFVILFFISCYQPVIVHSVCFMDDEGIILLKYDCPDGSNLDEFPPSQQKEGYVFCGWQDNYHILADDSYVISESCIFRPVFVKISDAFSIMKNVVFFGDSIGAGVGWIIEPDRFPERYSCPYYPGLGYSGGWAFLFSNQYTDLNVYNFSVGGAHLSDEIKFGPYYQEQLDHFCELYPDCNVDLFIVETTFNDEPSISIADTSSEVAVSCLRKFLVSIMERFPDSEIIVFNSPDGRFQEKENTELGSIPLDLLSGFNRICNELGLDYYDLRNDLCLTEQYGDNWYDELYVDGIHPNELLYRRFIYPALLDFIIRSTAIIP